jgi:hypothetical protein
VHLQRLAALCTCQPLVHAWSRATPLPACDAAAPDCSVPKQVGLIVIFWVRLSKMKLIRMDRWK